MKKKVLGGLTIIAIAAIVSSNVNVDALSSGEYGSMLKKQNIEALASDTSGEVVRCYGTGEVWCAPAGVKVLFVY